jgi:RsiW-degrading membrane proteinase PrsW (M82 family)
MKYYEGMTTFASILLFVTIIIVPLRHLLLYSNPYDPNTVFLTGVLVFIGFFGMVVGALMIVYFYPKYKNRLFGKEVYEGLDY